MQKNPTVVQGERITSTMDTSYRLAYTFVTFALVIDVGIRFGFQQIPWDLLGILSGGGLVALIYQVRQKALPPKTGRSVLLVMVVSAIAAAIMALAYVAIRS